MPFTHVEIQERKTRHIAVLFLFLVGLYAASLLLLVLGIQWFGGLAITTQGTLILVGVSLACGAAHWLWSTHRLFERVLAAVGAQPANLDDTYHVKFANIVQEVSVALGGRAVQSYVMPTTAVNACAVVDFSGRGAIAVTEGALSMLTRAQLESVVGHEAAHIASGDGLSTSVFCALFALHEEALKRVSRAFDERSGWRAFRGRGAGLVVFVYLVLACTSFVKTACMMLISREKEYRADADAVRLTRNPLSLAEALALITRRWSGVGMRGESLSSLFIVDPGVERFSEREGMWADLFSTHPPTEQRVALLLGMAHVDPGRFEEALAAAPFRPRARTLPPSAVMADAAPPQWMVWTDGQWRGPFGQADLANDELLLPESWVRRVDGDVTKPAHQDPQLMELFRQRYAGQDEVASKATCPRCRVSLVAVTYEGAPIEACPACRGCYVDATTMTKVFSREEYDFPEPIKRLGDLLVSTPGSDLAARQRQAIASRPVQWRCPQCGAAMVKKFYTEVYPVEVEQCWACGVTWLDHDELELLQYLYEKRQQRRRQTEGPSWVEQPPAV